MGTQQEECQDLPTYQYDRCNFYQLKIFVFYYKVYKEYYVQITLLSYIFKSPRKFYLMAHLVKDVLISLFIFFTDLFVPITRYI